MDLFQAFKNHSSKSKIVAIINSKHFKIDQLGDDGLSALHRASKEGMLDLVKFLVQKKANIDKQLIENGRFKEETALMLAIQGRHNDVAIHMINNGANPNGGYG